MNMDYMTKYLAKKKKFFHSMVVSYLAFSIWHLSTNLSRKRIQTITNNRHTEYPNCKDLKSGEYSQISLRRFPLFTVVHVNENTFVKSCERQYCVSQCEWKIFCTVTWI